MSQQIIEWSIDGIRVLNADASGHVSHLGLWPTFEHHDTSFTPQEIGEKLKSWLAESGLHAGQAILVLPRESVVIRQLQLPLAPEDEIPDLVRFQSASKSSLPIDDLALDYLPMSASGAGEGLSVVTASIDRKRLQRIKQILTSAGFDVVRATTTPLTIGHFVKKFGGASLGANQPEIVVFQRDSLIEISIFAGGSLVFSHSMALPESNRLKPLDSGLTRSIVALHQTHPDVAINRCYLAGFGNDKEVRELLESKFRGNVTHVELPESHSGNNEISGFEPLIGAALPVDAKNLKLDLLHPRKRIEKPDRRKLYSIVGGIVAVLFLMLTYGIFLSRKGTLEGSIDSLKESIAEIEQNLTAGEPQAEAFEKIDNWSLTQTNPVIAWNQLRSNMPDTDRLYLTELRLQPVNEEDTVARFTGVGFAKHRDDVDELYFELAENGFQVTPLAPTPTLIDPDYPIRFELDIRQLRVQPDPPEKQKVIVDDAESESESKVQS